jgi:orotate phosphoribosyltransferase
MNQKERLVFWLFETDALRVCPEKKPFFYTSGTIGPYYINTHFLYGDEKSASLFLSKIDGYLKEGRNVSARIASEARKNYEKGGVYRDQMDDIVATIVERIPLGKIDYISGGERRDWFFSFEVARLLRKPHLTIFKDKTVEVYKSDELIKKPDLEGARIFHISDLITEASSYERAWIPAIEALGAKMLWSLSVVDRLQGGTELLANHGVTQVSLIGVERELFDRALAVQKITKEQYNMILAYLADPTGAMTAFLKENPEFLKNAVNADEKTKARAKLLIDSGVYGVKYE